VQDLSVVARPSERLPSAASGSATKVTKKPSIVAQQQAVVEPQAVTITAQPQASPIQASAMQASSVQASSVQASTIRQPNQPSTSPISVKPISSDSAVAIAMLEKPKPLVDASAKLPASSRAVVEQLLAKADQLKAQGKVTEAIIQLQRAQRIAPRDPKVYARLAALQLSLGEASRAEQLALKGLTLVPNKKTYQYYFWRLIAASRSHLGDVSGEAKAIGEAAKYK
jgi:Flp pilus assembly protein TadD